jgi:hypothetical protein
MYWRRGRGLQLGSAVIAASFLWLFGFAKHSTLEETLLAAQAGENIRG